MTLELTKYASLILLITSSLFVSCNRQSSPPEHSVTAVSSSQTKQPAPTDDAAERTDSSKYFLKVFQGDIGNEQLRLFLDTNDHQFILEKTQNRSSGVNKRAARYGTWQDNKKQIVLTFAKEQNNYKLIKQGNNWIMQSAKASSDSTAASDKILFQYRPDLIQFPDAPLQLEGMYFYDNHTAMFDDCHTDKQTPVELSPILNKKYRDIIGRQKNRWVYVKMQANFAILPSATESQIMQKHLVLNADDVVFNAKKQCPTPTPVQPSTDLN